MNQTPGEPRGPSPVYLEDTVQQHMSRAIRLEREAADLKRKGREYEASIAVSDAEDAWKRMEEAMNTLRGLNPDVVS